MGPIRIGVQNEMANMKKITCKLRLKVYSEILLAASHLLAAKKCSVQVKTAAPKYTKNCLLNFKRTPIYTCQDRLHLYNNKHCHWLSWRFKWPTSDPQEALKERKCWISGSFFSLSSFSSCPINQLVVMACNSKWNGGFRFPAYCQSPSLHYYKFRAFWFVNFIHTFLSMSQVPVLFLVSTLLVCSYFLDYQSIEWVL